MIRLGRGKWKGHILRPSSFSCRPTSSLLRGAFFDIIGYEFLKYSIVWDLCSGSGAVGLEALSWGASKCVFIDRNPSATSFTRSFLREHDSMEDALILTGDVRRLVPRLDSKPDIVFIDPPYKHHKLYEWINSIDWKRVLSEEGMVFVECGNGSILKQGWEQRRYGDSYLKWKTTEEMNENK